MTKNNIIGLGLLLVFLVMGGGIVYQMYINKDAEQGDTKNQAEDITKDSFTFSYTYKGDSLWEYTIVGTLPNPCYKISTESVVLESYPEQVTIKSTVKSPLKNESCTEEIVDVNEIGQFQASELAQITFQVDN